MTESISQWAYDAITIMIAVILLACLICGVCFLAWYFIKQEKHEADYIKTLTDEEKKTIINYKANRVFDPFKKGKK